MPPSAIAETGSSVDAEDTSETLVGAMLRRRLAQAWKVVLAKNGKTITSAIHELAISQVEQAGEMSPSEIADARAQFEPNGRRRRTPRI